ncbi:MAG: SUMF1/EgtB/PvdO family nonheme iron enzyme [Lentisphaeria bacterium]|nr:SUMF1/EgtB/PvdO family nonheme iron enzyme [Lentisphaeria bacterium]
MADMNTQGIPTPEIPSAASPRGGTVNSEGVMVFQTGSGELPNVIQYLNFSRHTGQLEVDPKNVLGERGVICFRDGEAYYARQGIKRGVDAVVDMIGFKAAEGVFFPGGGVQTANIDMPTRDLVLKVAVEADERARQAPSSDDDDDDFFLGDQSVSRVVVKENKPVIAAPPAAAAPVGGGKRRGWMVAVILLAVGAVVMNGIWLLGEVRERGSRRVEAHERAAQAEKQAALEAQRQKKIAELLFDGVQAFKNNALRVAEEKAEAVLTVDPGNKRALDLQRRVVEAMDLSVVLDLNEKVSGIRQAVDLLRDNPVFKEDAAAVGKRQEQGALHLEHADYKKAIVEFQACLAAAGALLERHDHYEKALAGKKACGLAQSRAAAASAPRYAGDVFNQAMDKEKAAADSFERKDWAAAAKSWDEATHLFTTAAGTANDFAAMKSAQAEFEKALGGVDERVLNEYAPVEAKRVQENSREALELATGGNLKEAAELWKANTALLADAWEKAARARSAAVYAMRMKEAREAVQERDWRKAMTALDDLMALPAFKENAEVRGLWEQACHAHYVSQITVLTADKKWEELKTAATEMLRLRPGDPVGENAMKLAEDGLLPRLRFSVTSRGKAVSQCDITVTGGEVVVESPLTYRLAAGKEYVFDLRLPQENGIYFKPVTFRYGPAVPGLKTVELDIPPVSPPRFGAPWTVPGTTLEFAPVDSGSFMMGSAKRGDEQPPHAVRVSRPMWVATTETTNAQFKQFITEDTYDGTADCRPGYLKHLSAKTDVPDGDRFPIVYISWKNAWAFCQWLTRRERQGGRLPDGYVYRLPTEAEWEFACRAGTTEDFAGDPSAMAWHGNRSSNTAGTGLLEPNPWGLYDMHGNVWEFCHDWHDAYSAGDQTDPVGPPKGIYKVIRGGSWRDSLEQCRSSWRRQITVAEPLNNVGFRVVLAPAL